MSFPYHRMIRASAGSGKTYALTTRYLGLILSGEPADSILAVTFTRSAAGEIMERILERLLGALSNEGLEELLSALQAEGFAELSQSMRSCSNEEAKNQWIKPALTELLSQLHRCQVSTLDAFFSKVATGFTFECGLTPGWQILDEEILAKVRSSSIQKILSAQGSTGARNLMHRLNKGSLGSQVAADLDRLVTQFHEKWREFPESAWDLPAEKLGPDSDQLDRAFDELVRYPCPTNKSNEKLTKWEESLDSIRNAWSEDLLKRLEVCKTGLASKVVSGDLSFYRREIPEDLCRLIGVFLDQISSEFCNLIRTQNLSTGQFLSQYDEFRNRGLKEQGGLNYSDVPVALLHARIFGQPGLIDDRMDAAVRHILLDEFQDTSFIQFAVLAPLIEELASDSAGGRTLFCVGDSKQAIYGWRGGRAEVMDLFASKLLPDSEVQFDESWRSSDPVISTVNQTFNHLSPNAPKEGDQPSIDTWSSLFTEHKVATPLGQKPDGHVTLRIAPEFPDKAEKVWPYLETLEEVERLRTLSADGSIAILLRKNQQISRLVAALKARGIEASEERGNPLTDSPAVGRLLALIDAIEHPDDGMMKCAVQNSPLPQILHWQQEDDWEDVLSNLRKQIFDTGLAETFGPICDAFSRLLPDEEQLRISQFMEQVRSLGFHGLRLADLITALRQRPVPRPGGSPVQVMTVHQAKGLEFDAVILPELNLRWFTPTPQILSLEHESQPQNLSRYVAEKQLSLVGEPFPEMHQQSRNHRLSEALSLLYVAMTRARHTLTMLLPPPGKKGDYYEATYSSLLVSTLADDSERNPGNTLYQCGKPADFSSGKSSAADRSPISQRKIDPAASREDQKRASQKAIRLTAERRRSLRLGTLVHGLLERCHWEITDSNQAAEMLKQKFPRDRALHNEAAEIFSHAFSNEEFKNLFEQQETRRRLSCADQDDLVIESELPVITRAGSNEFYGVIDRLSLRFSGGKAVAAEVIDFKTDSSASSADELLDKYRVQLEAYQSAIHEGWRIPRNQIDTRIAHVNSGTVSAQTLSK